MAISELFGSILEIMIRDTSTTIKHWRYEFELVTKNNWLQHTFTWELFVSIVGNMRMPVNYSGKLLLSMKKLATEELVKANILCSLASVEKTTGEHEKAIELYAEALQISKEAKDIRREGIMNGNLGTVYHALGDLSTAKTYFEKSLGTKMEKALLSITLVVCIIHWVNTLGQ